MSMVFGKKKVEILETCQKCGAVLPISKLKKCHNCGMVLCRKCRHHHECDKTPNREAKTTIPANSQTYIPTELPQYNSYIHDGYDNGVPIIHIDTQSGQTIFREGNYHNPQCVIKITDMRIYEIARNPSIMTQEEEFIIYNDSDIHRRYMKYREEIKEKGY